MNDGVFSMDQRNESESKERAEGGRQHGKEKTVIFDWSDLVLIFRAEAIFNFSPDVQLRTDLN